METLFLEVPPSIFRRVAARKLFKGYAFQPCLLITFNNVAITCDSDGYGFEKGQAITFPLLSIDEQKSITVSNISLVLNLKHPIHGDVTLGLSRVLNENNLESF